MYFETDDLRQSYVVAKNEIVKFIRGKRFLAYVLLTVLIFVLITVIPYALGDGFSDVPVEVISLYASNVSFLIILAATLFASVVIVSEFEERTALVLFTRPIKKTSIFLGKVVGCIILETLMVVAYYLGAAVVSLIVAGGIPTEFFTSLGLAFMFIIATSGVAVLFSSVMKRGSMSAILTFFFFMMMLTIITTLIYYSGGVEPWFMADAAAGAIDPLAVTIEPLVFVPGPGIAAMTMTVWGSVSLVLAWLAFTRREF